MLDEENLKTLLKESFQDVILYLYTDDLGTDSLVRLIDMINNRINIANLVVDTGI